MGAWADRLGNDDRVQSVIIIAQRKVDIDMGPDGSTMATCVACTHNTDPLHQMIAIESLIHLLKGGKIGMYANALEITRKVNEETGAKVAPPSDKLIADANHIMSCLDQMLSTLESAMTDTTRVVKH